MPASVSRTSFNAVREFVEKEAAIQLPEGKEYLVAARLSQLATRYGDPSADALVERWRSTRDSEIGEAIVAALTTNETYFFRDPRPFGALKQHVFPSLVEAAGSNRRLRVWSAACSTGQEVYSLAMLLYQHFQELRRWDVEVLGTDLNKDVVERAKEGTYRQVEVGRGLPAKYLARYFERAGPRWRVRDELRGWTRFEPLNLVKPWPAIGPFDLVLLRNVLIYFDDPTKASILRAAAGVLHPHGVLVLGATESTLGLDVPLERVDLDGVSVYRRAGSPGSRKVA